MNLETLQCRIGSLETIKSPTQKQKDLQCRIGSLEKPAD